eukprot:2746192-Amphidinium_carterae.1
MKLVALMKSANPRTMQRDNFLSTNGQGRRNALQLVDGADTSTIRALWQQWHNVEVQGRQWPRLVALV